MCSGAGDWTCLQPGFPIRKSSDHSLVIDYPRLIADSYVLLRFLVPRHPPCALKNLNTTKMLASTVKFSKYNRHPTPTTASCDLGEAHDQKKPAHTHQSNRPDPERARPARAGTCRPILQDPTTCQTPHPLNRLVPLRSFRRTCACTEDLSTRTVSNNRCSTLEHPLPHTRGQTGLCHHQRS